MRRAHSTTGRDKSAAITRRLRAALEGGVPLSRTELSSRACCSERTVHNYLADPEQTLGVRVRRVRGADRVVRFVAESASTTVEQLAQALAHEMLRRVFPIAGTRFDRRRAAGLQLVVSVRGTYLYDERHLRVLRRWLQAASGRPRRALKLGYSGKTPIVWPIGIAVRDLARVYLAGVPGIANDKADVRTYALERVDLGVPVIFTNQEPPPGIDFARVADAIDDPFSMFAPGPDAVNVHVRFAAAEAKYVVGRLWHRTQKLKTLDDGRLDMTFGPADLHEAAAWVRQWGRGVRVLGDHRLLEELNVK